MFLLLRYRAALDAANKSTPKIWFKLLSFKNIVLRLMATRGQHSRDQKQTTIRRPLALFQRRELTTLLDETPADIPDAVESIWDVAVINPVPSDQLQQVQQLLNEGAVQEALQPLDSEHEPWDQLNWNRQQKLHPPQEKPLAATLRQQVDPTLARRSPFLDNPFLDRKSVAGQGGCAMGRAPFGYEHLSGPLRRGFRRRRGISLGAVVGRSG
jgi:hypothetical protein